jgi:starvation-inducible DNA-binding protein
MMATSGVEIEVTPVGVDAAMRRRREIAEGLSRLLADTFTLYLKTHGFHWNVTGPHFHTLHAMFEEQYRDLWQSVDQIAERIRALGFAAPGAFGELVKLASVGEAQGAPGADTMIRQLVRDHETAARTARQALVVAEDGRDAPTADLVTERIGTHEKAARMLRSLLVEPEEIPERLVG